MRFGSASYQEGKEDKNRMYESPKHSISVDSAGVISKKYDKSEKRTTLVDGEE